MSGSEKYIKARDLSELPDSLRDKRLLENGETFCFGCHDGLPCFTKCCSDVNILLTPLDVLRLSRRTGISTTDFLHKYTQIPITKDLHLPVVMLRMGDDPEKKCPFVGEAGCTVYEDRPWSCRMYPLGMGLPPARAGEHPQPIYFLFEDDFCHGAEGKREWDHDSWRDNQGVVEREELEIGYRDVVSHPWFIGGRQLDPKRIEMFHFAFYDLDRFRRFIYESSFLKRFDVEEELIEQMRTDDEALLKFASRWLRFALFAEPTMKMRDENSASKSK